MISKDIQRESNNNSQPVDSFFFGQVIFFEYIPKLFPPIRTKSYSISAPISMIFAVISGAVIVLSSALLLIPTTRRLIIKGVLAAALFLIRQLLRFYNRYRPAPLKQKGGLIPLVPLYDGKHVEKYEQEINKALINPVVQNLALTGSYGSGKSTLIKTFFFRNPQYRPLYVSLGAFKDNDATPIKSSDGKVETGGLDITQKIEYSILQQLFYSVQEKTIPYSRFQRIRPISKSKGIVLTVLTLIVLGAVLHNAQRSWLPVTISLKQITSYETLPVDLANHGKAVPLDSTRSIKPEHLVNYWDYASIFFLLGGTSVLLYILIRLFRLGLIKLSVQGAEIEISKNKDLSILNKHLDEILYFFSETKYDVLVLEDLDRFSNAEIFVKLRELSTLVNNKAGSIKRKVTFIYALKDDVFKDEKKRTKFFDLIIPVVPYINATNSADSLIEMFDNLNLNRPVSKSFLSDLSLFITDHRLITNIYNEFVVYHGQLDNEKLSNNKLLALIVYKNIHPADYSSLQENKGNLYDLFQEKSTIIKEQLTVLATRSQEIRKQINIVNLLISKSLKELRLIYLAELYRAIRSQSPSFIGLVQINNEQRYLLEAHSDRDFGFLMKENYLNIYIRSGNYNGIDNPFKAVEKEIDPNSPYATRENVLMGQLNYDLQELELALSNTESHFSKIKGYTFNQVLTIKPLSEFGTPIVEDGRLTFMIRGGHLSEDYKYYLSYLMAGQLSQGDTEYILAVTMPTFLPWEHQITDPRAVVERIDEIFFSYREALNFDIFTYLLKNPEKYPGKYKTLMNQLAVVNAVILEFIEAYRITDASVFGLAIKAVVEFADKFWINIRSFNSIDSETKYRYLVSLIQYGSLERLQQQDINKYFSRDIAENASLLTINEGIIVKNYTALILSMGIKVSSAPSNISHAYNPEILNFILEHSLYYLNIEMLDRLTEHLALNKTYPIIRESRLSILLKHGPEPMQNHIRENIGDYVRNIYFNEINHDKEAAEVIELILNSEQLTGEEKHVVLTNTEIELTEPSLIPEDMWKSAFSLGRIKPTWQNASVYRLKFGMDDALSAAINTDHAATQLSLRPIGPDSGETESESTDLMLTVLSVLENGNISEPRRISIANALQFTTSGIDFTHIGSVFAEKLFPNLLFSVPTALELKRVNYPLFAVFVVKFWQDSTTVFDHLELDANDFEALLRHVTDDDMKFFIYNQLTIQLFIDLLKRRVRFPDSVFEREDLQLSDDEINGLAGPILPSVVAQLFANYAGKLSLLTVKTHLLALGGDYRKIAEAKVKTVDKNDVMAEILETLIIVKILIAKATPKTKLIAIEYLPDAKQQ